MKKVWIAMFVVLLAVVGSVPKDGTAAAAAEKQVLRIGMEELPIRLDPMDIASGDKDAATIIKGLYEGLVRLDKNGKPVPGAAQSWKVGADGMTYTFKLRTNAKWSNGKKLIASDFVYAWKRALTPGHEPGNLFKMYYIAGAESYHAGKQKDFAKVGVKAVNDTTLQVTLKGKYAYFPSLLAEPIYYPVSQAAVKAAAGSTSAQQVASISNGPFQLQSRSILAITLSKNSYYYDAASIRLSEVDLLTPGPDSENATAAFVNGEVDWVGGGNVTIDFKYVDMVLESCFIYAPYASTYYYQFNLKQKPFSNLNIRKALALAVERNDMPMLMPAYGFVPWTLFGSKGQFRSEISDSAYYHANLSKAKALLKTGLQQEGLTELPAFSIIVNEGDTHAVMAKRLVNQWKEKLGVTATVETQSWQSVLAKQQSGNFQVARAGWSADYNDPATFLNYFRSDSADNDSGWLNKTYDQYVKQAEQTFDSTKRVHLYAKAEQLLMSQAVIVPLYNYVADILRNSWITGVYIDYDDSIAFSRGYWTHYPY
ncbi:peptide ABC transporter substrate-binding protein [Paenibacillus sp. 19GGS1-52]|uniref:peptide ABC transporter substrate-binding protein n=1 Tax=Paenibacillus sp. 19GGS1-52 TaxID=2758563 RepID=UPI001EFBC23A|nr:peptide ABC transporter substrate-binding protein [Paenibacillus sp. 19GGS1-52]ULO04881.1 peptide ABC transporter substrate-binding protein [Paenibacillus sp. 19GGS1-52]